ncbi:MAG: hypothetical protein NZL95_03890 [Chitinophagales bacterium]|nr:hypothetical protein [Chitinophagales bacterium]MDW8427672.1 hypothetical protein [Chitinophagales bacterium]
MRNRRFLAAWTIGLVVTLPLWAQQSFDRQTISIGNLGLSLTNVGTLGRPDRVNDPTGPPSMEYPLKSGIEHLFEGGIWIGALVEGQTAVSTAAVDAPTGYNAGAAGFEFTAEPGSFIQQRSTLSYSDYFSLAAVSHQDMVMEFTDAYTIIPGTSIPIADHQLPLGARVRLEAYAWNYSFADYFVILNYTITNASNKIWDSVWVGMWTDLVVRNVYVATDNGTAFFSHGGGGYVDSLTALYAYDVDGDPGYTNSYGASQFLGILWRDQFLHPVNAAQVIAAGYPEPRVHANFWNFRKFDGTQFGAPADDVQRYQKLKQGLDFTDPMLVTQLKLPSNRIQLLSAGPILQVLPGESFTYVAALVCARQLKGGVDDSESRRELEEHLGWSRRTFLGEDTNENGRLDEGEDLIPNGKLDRYILPEPPAEPRVRVVAGANAVTVYWDDRAEASVDPISKKKDFEGYRIYRSNVGDEIKNITALNLIAQWDKPDNNVGYNNGFSLVRLNEPVFFEGDTTAYWYRFELTGLLNGWQYVLVVTAFDEGDAQLGLEPLESSFTVNTFRVWPGTPPTDSNRVGVYPNPYRQHAAWDGPTAQSQKIWFYNLPEHCEITIYTLSGEVVAVLQHDSRYIGQDIRWFEQYGGDPKQRRFSGGEHAWDLLSTNRQAVAQGVYLFSVKDLRTGAVQQGQFVIMR